MERQRELFDMASRLRALNVPDISEQYEFPLKDIIACMEDVELQLKHNALSAKKRFGRSVQHDADDCFWFWFQSPAATWKNLCGRAGWMALSRRDLTHIAFILEVMS